jgi:hypothetical protein
VLSVGRHVSNLRGEEYFGSATIVGLWVTNPLAHTALLQLGRAYARQGDTTKAKSAYQDFLTLWNADPDIPILKQAEAENAKLQ